MPDPRHAGDGADSTLNHLRNAEMDIVIGMYMRCNCAVVSTSIDLKLDVLQTLLDEMVRVGEVFEQLSKSLKSGTAVKSRVSFMQRYVTVCLGWAQFAVLVATEPRARDWGPLKQAIALKSTWTQFAEAMVPAEWATFAGDSIRAPKQLRTLN